MDKRNCAEYRTRDQKLYRRCRFQLLFRTLIHVKLKDQTLWNNAWLLSPRIRCWKLVTLDAKYSCQSLDCSRICLWTSFLHRLVEGSRIIAFESWFETISEHLGMTDWGITNDPLATRFRFWFVLRIPLRRNIGIDGRIAVFCGHGSEQVTFLWSWHQLRIHLRPL